MIKYRSKEIWWATIPLFWLKENRQNSHVFKKYFNIFFKRSPFLKFLLEYGYFTMLYWFLLQSKVNQLYIYRSPLLDFLPLQATTEDWRELPVKYSRFPFVIQFIHSINSMYMSMSISQLIPSHLSSPGSIHLFSMSVFLFLLCK